MLFSYCFLVSLVDMFSNAKKRATGKKASRKQIRQAAKLGVMPLAIARAQTTATQRGYLPFADRYNVQLPYASSIVLNTAGSSVVVTNPQIYRLNSLYDPDYTSAGHQPYQYDQLNLLYKYYIVHDVDIDVEFTDPSGDGQWVGMKAYTQDDSTYGPSTGKSIDTLVEQGYSAVKALNNTGSQRVRLSAHIDLPKLAGLTRAQYLAGTTSYGGANASNPSYIFWLDLFNIDPNGAVAVKSVNAVVRFTFHAQLYMLINVAPS